ncbi:NUDIX hydrolase [Streptomyces sp. AV19]|uniref:NUDIX domain-containing protein n=1 Tax=Streptomyces sp. AV19 TaxID=2793068 RepID=UPI0018FEDC3B|nr:NUDIX hydrolase [Streptomyces sp. AV19]MBH1938444.1 NUDIX hydrolase [Streptomyces sp. AV19]MDG4535092.1 NUDIX hydrolase [Streptomyces sp. AV19]
MPSPRIRALALILNGDGKALLVSPYRKGAAPGAGRNFQLPGGTAWEDEPAWEAMVREGKRATGLALTPVRLVLTDFTPRDQHTYAPPAIDFVYQTLTVPDDATVRLPHPDSRYVPELAAYKWLAQHDLHTHCTTYQAHRITAALYAARTGGCAELHAGRPAYAHAA